MSDRMTVDQASLDLARRREQVFQRMRAQETAAEAILVLAESPEGDPWTGLLELARRLDEQAGAL